MITLPNKNYVHVIQTFTIFATWTLPVRKGISSLLVLSTPKAKAIVDSFLMEFSRNYKVFTKSQISTKLAR